MQGRHEPIKTENNSCNLNFIKKILNNCNTIIKIEVDHLKISMESWTTTSDKIDFYDLFVKVDREKSFQVICDTFLQNNSIWLEVR